MRAATCHNDAMEITPRPRQHERHAPGCRRRLLPAGAALLATGMLMVGPAALAAASPVLAASTLPAAQTAFAPAALGAAPAASTPVGITSAAHPASLPNASLTSQVTDDAGLLTSTSSDAVASLGERGVNLWVVTYADASETATDFAERAWRATGLGTSDLLLVINVADGARSYAFDGAASGSVWSASKRDDVRATVKERLSEGDWDGAVTAVADAGASGDSSTWGQDRTGTDGESPATSSEESDGAGLGLTLGVGALAAAGGYAYYRARRRSRAEAGSGVGPSAGGRRGAGGTGSPADLTHLPLDQLATRSGNALVAADDAVRTGEEELAFAEAEFGPTGAEELRQALEEARADLQAAFEQRRLLDDAIPDTPAQQRQMHTEIVRRAEHAQLLLTTALTRLGERRAQETNLPAELSRTAGLLQARRADLTSARRVLASLQQVYTGERVERLAAIPDQTEGLLDAAATALEQARASDAAGDRAAALEQLRVVQHALAQAGTLIHQVTGARERWEAEDRQAAAQVAAAEQARTQLPSRLARLSTQLQEVDAFVATHRGAVGAGARTALSEAHRLHSAASGQVGTDPAGALAQVEQAERLVAQAQTAAEADVRSHRDRDDWDGRHGRGGRGYGGGLDLGSLVLGGILLGGLGGHHDHGGEHPGSWGGWGSSGSWGGGGFGGGSFGGGGGGFGGGGGSF